MHPSLQQLVSNTSGLPGSRGDVGSTQRQPSPQIPVYRLQLAPSHLHEQTCPLHGHAVVVVVEHTADTWHAVYWTTTVALVDGQGTVGGQQFEHGPEHVSDTYDHAPPLEQE